MRVAAESAHMSLPCLQQLDHAVERRRIKLGRDLDAPTPGQEDGHPRTLSHRLRLAPAFEHFDRHQPAAGRARLRRCKVGLVERIPRSRGNTTLSR
jgi:hypothetical protein